MRKNYFLKSVLFTFLFVGFTAISAQNISMIPGAAPSPIVKQGDSVNFTLNIRNPQAGTNRPGANLRITIPDNWKMKSTNPSFSTFAGNTYTISGLDLSPGIDTTITVSLQALCDAADHDEIAYNLYASDNTTLVASAKNSDVTEGVISNIMAPFLRFSSTEGIPALVMFSGRPSEREWDIVQGGPGAHVKNIKIVIPCDTNKVELNDILYKLPDNTYESVGITSDHYVKDRTGYTIYIDEAIIKKITGSDKLMYGQSISLKEVLTFYDCATTLTLTYSIYYGNGEDWCLGLTDDNSLSVPAANFQPWIEWVTTGTTFTASSGAQANAGLHVFPTGSTGAPDKSTGWQMYMTKV